MIKFEKIRWMNVLSFGNYWTELDLSKNDITVIVGDNGAGKSTFLDCLSFVLFGKTFRKINKPQIVNSITKKNCLIEIIFESYGHHYLIRRGMKPNIFDIYRDSLLVPQDAHTGDYQDYLEKEILRCNHKTFCQMVILGAANYTPFFDMQALDRRRFVEAIFDLEIISLMNVILKKDSSETDNEIHNLELEKLRINSIIKTIEEESNKNYQTIVETNQKLIDDLVATKKMYLEDISNRGMIDFDQKDLDDSIKNRELTNQQINHCNKRISEIEKEIKFFSDHSGAKCPTCYHEISYDIAESIISGCESSLKSFIDTLDKLKIIFQARLNKVDDLIKIRDYNEKTIRYVGEIERKIFDIDKQINYIKSVTLDAKKTKSQDSIDSHVEEKKIIEEKLDVLYKEKKKQDIILGLLRDDGVKATILKDNINIINDLVNQYLMNMDFFCSFNLNEEFEEIIKSRHRDEFSYHSFSQGERLRITLALLLTWREISKRRNSIDTNLLIFDEILDSSLDREGVNLFFELIKKVLKGRNVFIISHNQDSIEKINNVIKVEKIDSFSRYNEE